MKSVLVIFLGIIAIKIVLRASRQMIRDKIRSLLTEQSILTQQLEEWPKNSLGYKSLKLALAINELKIEISKAFLRA